MAATYKSMGVHTYSQGGIDAKVAANTLLVTTETGRNWLPLGVFIRSTAASGITVAATVSVGTNAGGGYNDIVAATALTGLTSAGIMIPVLALLSTPIIVPGATGIHINVSVAATGTSQTLEVILLGMYLEN